MLPQWQVKDPDHSVKSAGGRLHLKTHTPGVRQVPEGSGEQGKMEETGCEIICGAPATLAVLWDI